LDDFRPGQELENLTRRSLASKQHMQIDRVLADGRTLSINYNTFGRDGWIAIYRDVTKRRKDFQDVRDSERELKLQNARLDASIESMPYGFSIWDDNYRLVLSNDRYADMYGMPRAGIAPGMTLLDICHLTIASGNHPDTSPDQLFAAYRDRMERNRLSGGTDRYEKTIRDRTIRTSYKRSPGLGWVVSHEDITEDRARMVALKAREAELELQKLRLEAAVNNMPQGLCMFDAERRLVICNKQYANHYRLPPELLKPGTSLDAILDHRVKNGVFPLGQHDTYVQDRHSVLERGKDETHVVEFQDGRILSVSHHPMPDGGWVATQDDITEQRKHEERIRHVARHDSLTDLPNRLMFRELMETAEKHITRGGSLTVLAIDLDHFKAVNDTLGHGVGDLVLREVAARLRTCCRDGDVVSRLGGDEFAILANRLEEVTDAAAIAARIIKHIGEPFEIDGHQISIGASIGISVAPGDGKTAEELLKNADLALYRAKDNGRAAYHFFEKGMDAALQQRRALELGLRHALTGGEFRLVFQPLFNLELGRVCCLEALLRWYSPDRGTIPPNEFIPIAEESGLIVPIGEWVLREACRAATAWPADVRVAVNLSTVQFRHRCLFDHVKTALTESGLEPHRLELEVTESLLLVESELTLQTLHRLRELGVSISMDDFGTGYSSLSYLRSFPFDKIKIDQSFVKDLSAKEDSRAIVTAVIGLGRSLGMSTTAEGVETEAQLDLVREQGCTEVQGFLFSPPLPGSAITKLFSETGGVEEWTRALRKSA
jgi:diguanylate cyclase (GGDEF)-like protein